MVVFDLASDFGIADYKGRIVALHPSKTEQEYKMEKGSGVDLHLCDSKNDRLKKEQ